RLLPSLSLIVIGGTCLGFAPRSESFAIEPSVQVCSISSLSGLTSCRPSANPLNPHKAFKVFTIRLLKQ
ncbi:hypothetical protein IJO12_07170, partial [bacterium]|nr:hypothetical protein [bacterium]